MLKINAVQMTGQLIQKLKREIRNNRVAVDDLGSFRSTSKIMSDYKDFFVLSKNGQRALDVEVNSVGDVTLFTAKILPNDPLGNDEIVLIAT